MENLIKMLDELMESGDFTTVSDEDGNTYIDREATADIDRTACDLLIALNGQPDYDAIEQLKELSNGRYTAIPGGTDTFEWIAGSINTPVGVVVYG